MEVKPLTEEQKAKMKKLQRSFVANAAFSGLKLGFLICFVNIIITAIEFFYVHNEAFSFVAGLFSAILIFRSFRLAREKEYDRFKEEARKILES